MIVASVQIRNFRSVEDETLMCAPLTALVGRNGAGKSAFMKALDLFYSTSEAVTKEDFFNEDTNREIVVRVTFIDLPAAAKELFESRIENGALSVEKVIHWNGGKPRATYHGATLQIPAFAQIREGFEVKDRGKTAKAALERLRESGEFEDLPEWSTIPETQEALRAWEAEHTEECERMRDDGQFFGFRQVGEGYLGRFTRRLFIPAVRDASEDSVEGRGSVFSNLMDLVVRNVLASKEEVQDLRKRFSEEYEALMTPEKQPELGHLAAELSKSLQEFVPSAKVLLNWLALDQLDLPLPRADVKLVEDGYASPVDRCGHGLQRAFVVTMLQHLTVARISSDQAEDEGESGETEMPNLLLLMEEPELYQHPNRQRHFARILRSIAYGKTPGVADRTQVFYTTHSPHFVGIDRVHELRVLRKVASGEGAPKKSRVIQTNLDEVAEEIWTAVGEPGDCFTGLTLLPRLRAVMTPWMAEGFFADVAVLVEGEDDRAAILGMAECEGHDFEAAGISVIPCGGKTNLDRPLAIFRSLGIPVFPV